MENNIKILISLFAFCIINAESKAQSTYQKYDCVTRGVEYNITKSQINSNIKTMELIKESKKNYSIFNKSDSITRSRIQNVVSARQNENFRLNQKAFLLKDANRIDNIDEYNDAVRNLRRQMIESK
jgi:thermostable 8-oxoguanine DNA glycosylase